MGDPLAQRGGLEALEVAIGEDGALGGGGMRPRGHRRCRSRKRTLSLGATWGLRRGHVNPCEALSTDVIRKCAAGGHLWTKRRQNCCLLLHAVLASGVYNREVIPRWKERFGGASAAGA